LNLTKGSHEKQVTWITCWSLDFKVKELSGL